MAGFLGMLLLDQLQHKVGGSHGHGHMHGRGTPHLRSSDDELEEEMSAATLPPKAAGKVCSFYWMDVCRILTLARSCKHCLGTAYACVVAGLCEACTAAAFSKSTALRSDWAVRPVVSFISCRSISRTTQAAIALPAQTHPPKFA